MKFIVLIGDGIADLPIEALNFKTPLEVARLEYIGKIISSSTIGLVKNIPEGLPAGSDVACLSIFGYPPQKFYTGRGPIEAASLGIELDNNAVAYRCNLITVEGNILVDYSAGHISSEESRELIGTINKELANEDLLFYPGKSYRNILVLNNCKEVSMTFPPHDIVNKNWKEYLSQGESSTLINNLITKSHEILRRHEINIKRKSEGKNEANMIWPWGGGKKVNYQPFFSIYGLKGAVISAVDLIKGIGKLAGLEVVEVEGATGFIDTNYKGKVASAINSLKENDIVFIHIEAPDEMSHMGNIEGKISAIEMFDKFVVGGVLESINEPFKMLITADHATPLSLKTHTDIPVPFLIYEDNKYKNNNLNFSEKDAQKSNLFFKEGYKLMSYFLKC